MPMQENRECLNEQELEQLIAETEAASMHRAPDYLEQMIVQKAKRIETRESVEIVPIRNTFRQSGKVVTPSKGRQLLGYSLKIAAAAAAAITLVLAVPAMEATDYDSYRQQVSEEQQRRREEREKKREEKNIVQNVNEKTSDFCTLLFEKTNELLFQ